LIVNKSLFEPKMEKALEEVLEFGKKLDSFIE